MSVLKYFKNIPRSPSHRATGPKCNFFSSNLQRNLWRKKKAMSPPNGRQGFFFSRDLVANLKKKFTLKACRPMGGRPGGIFEIFQNGHIFLIFLFFKNIKKKKALLVAFDREAAGAQCPLCGSPWLGAEQGPVLQKETHEQFGAAWALSAG